MNEFIQVGLLYINLTQVSYICQEQGYIFVYFGNAQAPLRLPLFREGMDLIRFLSFERQVQDISRLSKPKAAPPEA